MQFGRIDEAYTQVIAFQRGRAPAYKKDLVWTANSESVTLSFTARVELPIRIWIICPDELAVCDGPLTQADRSYLTSFRVNANAVLNAERVGIRLVKAGGVLISDETQASDNPKDFANFNSGFQCSQFLARVSGLSPPKIVPGAFNLYVVATVDGSPSRGYNCSDGPHQWAVIGATGAWPTMLHEIGHTLALDHVDQWSATWGDPVWGPSDARDNYMYSNSDTRMFFTEGQTFRAHFNPGSAINKLLSIHTADERYCGLYNSDAEHAVPPCPKLEMRVWPDQ
jgi:hypothetical protein